jgi:hypothetical protein
VKKKEKSKAKKLALPRVLSAQDRRQQKLKKTADTFVWALFDLMNDGLMSPAYVIRGQALRARLLGHPANLVEMLETAADQCAADLLSEGARG